MTVYMIFEGESFIETGKIIEKPVSCKLNENDAKNFLGKWAAQMDQQIDILDWNRYGERKAEGYGKIGYETFNQERWCRYQKEEVSA